MEIYKSKQKNLYKGKNIKKSRNKKSNDIEIKNYYCFVLKLFLIIIFLCKTKTKVNIINYIKNENHYKNFEIMKKIFNNDTFVKSYLDNITILNHTYHKKYKNLKKNKNNINICVNLNDNYVYKLIVSMESVLSNCNKQKTFITYHVLCAPEVTENTLIILKSFMKRYSLNLEMIFYNMGNNFIFLSYRRYTQVTYYRLLLPIFINLDRILYLDGDTLTYKDISEIFQLDFNDNYVLGTLDYYSFGVDYLGLKSDRYINAGVILMNLEKIRNDKKYYDLINITNNVILRNDDQTAINYVLYPKIGQFPIKTNVFIFYDQSDINIYLNYLRVKINETQIEEALYDPMIIHSVGGPKFWDSNHKSFNCSKKKDCSCNNYQCIWYSYANKTDYYQEIISSIKK